MSLFVSGRQQQRAAQMSEDMLEALQRERGGGVGRSPAAVGWSGAMAIPAVFAAVRLRAELVATCPVDVYRRTPEGTAQPVATPLVLQTPGAGQGILSWLYASQVSLELRGNAYGRILHWDSRTALPDQIELLHPDTVTPMVDGGEILFYRVGNKRIPREEMWHEKINDMPGSPVGLSPIAACARSLGIQLAAEDFGAKFFTDGAHPTGLLSSTGSLTQEQIQTAKRLYLDVLDGRREPLVLGGAWNYEAISVKPEESQFLATMQFGVEQVARIFNVDPEMIGASSSGSSVTYANREQRAQDFLAYRFGPSVVRREQALTGLTVRGQYVKLNTNALLRTDLLTRLKAYQIGLAIGAYAFDEPRLLEDRAPLTSAEVQQLKDAGLLGKPTAAAPAAQPPTEA